MQTFSIERIGDCKNRRERSEIRDNIVKSEKSEDIEDILSIQGILSAWHYLL